MGYLSHRTNLGTHCCDVKVYSIKFEVGQNIALCASSTPNRNSVSLISVFLFIQPHFPQCIKYEVTSCYKQKIRHCGLMELKRKLALIRHGVDWVYDDSILNTFKLFLYVSTKYYFLDLSANICYKTDKQTLLTKLY